MKFKDFKDLFLSIIDKGKRFKKLCTLIAVLGIFTVLLLWKCEIKTPDGGEIKGGSTLETIVKILFE